MTMSTGDTINNQLGKILLFVTSYEKCDVSKRQLILKSVTLYVKIRKRCLYSDYDTIDNVL
jgi:hypothetical protein